MMLALSLGWGTQSFGLAVMSALGALPRLDVAIHADIGHERAATYEFAAEWTPWLEAHGVCVVTVRPAEKSAPGVNAWGGVHVPAYSERGGQLGRQCTGDWKVKPIRRWYQANRAGEKVYQWLGISADEARRMRTSDVHYVEHQWPLLCLPVPSPTGEPMSRADVANWLLAHDLPIPPRSHCVFCPFMSSSEWRSVKNSPDWPDAVAVDEQIREARPPGRLYLHRSLRPLAEVDFSTPEDRGQQRLGFGDECLGYCGN